MMMMIMTIYCILYINMFIFFDELLSAHIFHQAALLLLLLVSCLSSFLVLFTILSSANDDTTTRVGRCSYIFFLL